MILVLEVEELGLEIAGGREYLLVLVEGAVVLGVFFVELGLYVR